MDLDFMTLLTAITYPTTSGTNAFNDLIADFSQWIERIGAIIVFCGAVKFGIAVKDDDTKDKTFGLLTMASGFIIMAVASSANSNYLFSIPSAYNEAIALQRYNRIITFTKKWVRRIGAFIMFIGAVEFGLSIKNNDAAQKTASLKGFVSGAIISAVTTLL